MSTSVQSRLLAAEAIRWAFCEMLQVIFEFILITQLGDPHWIWSCMDGEEDDSGARRSRQIALVRCQSSVCTLTRVFGDETKSRIPTACQIMTARLVQGSAIDAKIMAVPWTRSTCGAIFVILR